jgi:hypothetical protein
VLDVGVTAPMPISAVELVYNVDYAQYYVYRVDVLPADSTLQCIGCVL